MPHSSKGDSVSGVLQPGQVIRPVLGPEQVAPLVSKLFGLTVTSVKELNSYDDKNFYIKVGPDCKNPHITEMCPDGYVLKILNSMDSKKVTIVESQNEAMLLLHARGFKVPVPQRSVNGTYLCLTKLTDGRAEDQGGAPGEENVVRLLTFIQGKIFHQVTYTAELFFEAGVYVARLDNELKAYRHEDLKKRELIWSLEKTPDLAKFMYALKDEGQRKLINEVLDAWQEKVVPALPSLERGFIHGDYNEQNIIVNATGEDPSTYHIDGLLDFGDIHYSCYVFELAITIMYQMVEVTTMPSNDVGGHTLAGYLSQRTVTEEEWHILKECIAARFAQSLVMGAYTHMQDPTNQYVIVTFARGWSVLTTFWNTPKQQLISRWKNIIKSYQEKPTLHI